MATPFDKQIIWIHWMGRVVREKTIAELATNVKTKAPTSTGIAVKTSDGADWQAKYDDDPEMRITGPEAIYKWARELALKGMQCHLWCVVRGLKPDEECAVIIAACKVPGVRSMILDVEGGPEYFGGRPASVAKYMIEKIRAGIPQDFHLALNFDYRGSHPANIHIQEWLPHVQSLHPMVYHWHFSESTRGPKRYIDDAFNILRTYNKPIVPMLQSYPDPSTGLMVPDEHMHTAGYYSFQKGAAGITYFRLGTFVGDPEYAAVGRIKPAEIPPLPPEDPTMTSEFQVVTLALNVRTEPTTEPRTIIQGKTLLLGQRVKVLPTSRLENEGIVWWRHKDGWSAERTINNANIYMIKATPTGTPADKTFQVIYLSLNIRSTPSINGTITGFFRMGEQVVVDTASRKEADGYVWWKHSTGWSAEKRTDLSEIYLYDATVDLPPTAFQFTRSPLDLASMGWFYYYGNTRFAYLYGALHNYDGYSQGLHGGLDFGYNATSSRTIPVYAGVNGVFDYSGSGRAFPPNRVDILTNGYLVIYGHVTNPIRVARGTAVTPNTVIGYIDANADHMHLEIRKSGYIYNPLLFMTRDIREAIFQKFPATGSYAFYQDSRWRDWITPLDQPVIQIGGPIIGPRA